MKPTRGNDEDDGGLDSLLDTMTNVVGILVLVLVVTQMSIAEVVTKITSENQIDEESLEQLDQQLEIERAELRDLEQILIDPLDIDADRQREELAKKRELLERRKALLAETTKRKTISRSKSQQTRNWRQRTPNRLPTRLPSVQNLKR